jgi:hypothetical protein
MNNFDAISRAFANLAESNQMLYDYWISELYDENDDLIIEKWNDETLKKMEDDVMQQMSI